MSLVVVQVVQEMSSVGGVETVAHELARAFSRAAIENIVVTSSVGEFVDSNIAVELVAPWLARIPTRGAMRYLGRALVIPIFTIAATLALRRRAGAMIISHGDSLKGDVLVVHAVNAQSLAEKRKAGSWWWLINPLHLWISLRDWWMIGGQRYRMFVAVSPRVKCELQNLYSVPAPRIRVIPNGIDLERFRRDAEAGRSIRQEFGISPEAKVLLFVGHEFRRKGLAHAIGALERLGGDVRLLVVGSDNPAPYQRMTNRAGDRLIFAGARSDLPAFYSAADAFVLPTAYETFSLVCMEAMACEVPVFATPVGGIEDYLVDGVNGYRIAMDADDIAEKIRSAFADSELLCRLREGARNTAERYDWNHIGLQYIELLKQIDAEKHDKDVDAHV